MAHWLDHPTDHWVVGLIFAGGSDFFRSEHSVLTGSPGEGKGKVKVEGGMGKGRGTGKGMGDWGGGGGLGTPSHPLPLVPSPGEPVGRLFRAYDF